MPRITQQDWSGRETQRISSGKYAVVCKINSYLGDAFFSKNNNPLKKANVKDLNLQPKGISSNKTKRNILDPNQVNKKTQMYFIK